MKKLFLAIMMLGHIGISTQAEGLPREDSIINLIRQKYYKAKPTVSLQALKDGSLKNCKTYLAMKGRFERYNSRFNLIEELDGLWEGEVAFSNDVSVGVTATIGENGSLLMVANDFGREKQRETKFFSREDQDNIYIEEVQFAPLKWHSGLRAMYCPLESNTVTSRDYVNECNGVAQYYVCPKQ